MINSYDFSSKLAIDSKNMEELRLLTKNKPDQALKEVAQQFEALFINMMLKSMREATPKNGLFDSQQTQFYTQMLDQQLAQSLSSKGVGIADMMIQQLTRMQAAPMQPETAIPNTESILNIDHPDNQSIIATSPEQLHDKSHLLWPSRPTISNESTPIGKSDFSFNNEPVQKPTASISSFSTSNQPKDFVNLLLPHAKAATQSTGIPPHFMIAQAALESGWGKHEIRHADNSPSYNLFGIKAGANWKGEVVETITTEYIDGEPRKVVEKFRAYDSYAEGFRDYANLLLNNPRYATVLKNDDAHTFAYGLQQAGYATDPLYADKLIRIINSNTVQNNLAI